MTDGDIDNVLAYSDGGGGLYTHFPWTCQPGPDVTTISQGTQDGLACSTWQIFHYIGEYCNQYNGSCGSSPAIPRLADHLFVEDGSAGLIEIQVLGLGHLYVQPYLSGNPVFEPLQGGSLLRGGPSPQSGFLDNRLVRAHFQQDTAKTDPRYPLPLSLASAYGAYATLNSEANIYDTYFPCCDPSYNVLNLNSNTWAAALLEVRRPGEIGKIAFNLTVDSVAFAVPRYPFGWETHSVIERPYFTTPHTP